MVHWKSQCQMLFLCDGKMKENWEKLNEFQFSSEKLIETKNQQREKKKNGFKNVQAKEMLENYFRREIKIKKKFSS